MVFIQMALKIGWTNTVMMTPDCTLDNFWSSNFTKQSSHYIISKKFSFGWTWNEEPWNVTFWTWIVGYTCNGSKLIKFRTMKFEEVYSVHSMYGPSSSLSIEETWYELLLNMETCELSFARPVPGEPCRSLQLRKQR